MSDLLDEQHAQAALTLLAADVFLTVFDGKVPDPTPDPPYVLVYTTVERPIEGIGNAVEGLSDTVITTWYCHCVGETAAAVRAVVMRVRTALLDQRPVITGRSCGLIRMGEVLAPNRDETTGRLVMDSTVTFSLTTAG